VSLSLNTQNLSLNLYTPKLGFPAIKRPSFSTNDHTQKPKKSNGVYIKSGVVFGNNLSNPKSFL